MKCAIFNRFEIAMTFEQAQSVSHSGNCDEDVEELVNDPDIQKQLQVIYDSDLIDELKECGAWDDEALLDREANNKRIIWIAGNDIVERE